MESKINQGLKDFLNHVSDNRILDVRYMNRDEASILGLGQSGLVLLLDNGVKIYAISADNKAATMVIASYRGKTKIKPIQL